MKIKLSCLFWPVLTMIPASVTASPDSHQEIFVSASSQNGNGTAEAPFPDIQSAVNHIREIRSNADTRTTDVTVSIKGGSYRLSSPIVLSCDAFGKNNGHTVFRAVPGEKVIISGGAKLTGWNETADAAGLPEVAKGHVWSAPLPETAMNYDGIRQLWVNGVRMKRASSFDDYAMNRIIKADKDNRQLIVPAAPSSLVNAPNLEMTIIQDWVINFMRVNKMQT